MNKDLEGGMFTKAYQQKQYHLFYLSRSENCKSPIQSKWEEKETLQAKNELNTCGIFSPKSKITHQFVS